MFTSLHISAAAETQAATARSVYLWGSKFELILNGSVMLSAFPFPVAWSYNVYMKFLYEASDLWWRERERRVLEHVSLFPRGS